MRTAPRSTRRTTAAQPLADKENRTNRGPSQRGTVTTMSNRKARHRVSITELARLEDVFRQETHPSRQQKRDLAAELGMDYKTVTIWFQNKRQTSKRGLNQLLVEGSDGSSERARSDSCLRSVSSPSHNATLDASGVGSTANVSSESKGPRDGLASKAIVKIKPLLDSLNALTSRPGDHSGSTEAKDETLNAKDIDIDSHRPRTQSENSIALAALDRHEQIAEQEQTKERPVKWKRIRTLEWACERQARRRKLSREGYVRLGSEEIQDGDPNNPRMDSALSLLSLASSTQVGPPKDVMWGASLLLSFKHSWHRA
ncbi:hypothetical protein J3R82DRAFT_473 [Butyriboletus roseoflavus]|nr:hypothetical protein J3R82DRAFT_473 [Butyriboletus roseoflavus]